MTLVLFLLLAKDLAAVLPLTSDYVEKKEQATKLFPPEICNNGIDDDLDGLIDCADSDCLPIVTYGIIDCQATNADINLTVSGGNTPYNYKWSDMVAEAIWSGNNTTNDASGNARNLGIGSVGIITYDAADKVEGSHSFIFNGATFLRYGVDGGFLETAYSVRTYSMWVKPSNLTGIKILFEQGGSTAGMAARLNGNILTAAYRASSTQYTTGNLTFPADGAWHHVAVVFNGGTLTCYLDGVASTNATSAATSIAANNNNDALGARNGTDAFGSSAANFYSGRMDDVQIFYSALSAQRIADLARNDGDRLNLSAGTYSVTVSNSIGCSATRFITFTIPCIEVCNNGFDDDGDALIDCADNSCPLPTASISGTNSICPGANTMLTASGGVGYTWNTGASTAAITVTPVSTTTYTVTVTSANGCTASTTQMVTVNAFPASISGINSICPGANTTLTASGGVGYAWNTGASTAAITVTPISTTTYTVTVTSANGCTATANQTVTITACIENCINGIDDDGDGLIDCAEPDCQAIWQPNLAPDVYQTCPGEVFQEQPIFNDGNIQTPLYSIYTPATKGAVSINIQGIFTYTPNGTACGIDSFKYQVCNIISGCCDQATVILQVGDNLPPVLQNLPADITISCSDPIPSTPEVFGLDDCPGIYVTFDETNNQTSTGSCQNYSVIRTWTAYDRCGNYAIGKQTITVADVIEPEIFRVYTLENGNKLLAGIAQKVSTGWTRVKFPIAFDAPPSVFAQVVSINGIEPIAIRVKDVDEEGFFVKVQEQEQADGIHAVEQVAWMATPIGANDGAPKLHVGYATGITQTSSAINYGMTYSTAPVFIAVPQSNNEADPFTVRFPMQGVTSTQVMLQEEQSKDAEMLHAGESLAWLSMNAGDLTDYEGNFAGVAGTVSVGNAWVTVPLPRKFTKPVVLFGGQPSGNDPATIRVNNVTSNSFQVRIEEWPYLNNLMTNRPLSYLVVEGSIQAAVENPCNPEIISLVPGVDLFAVDDCDNQVTLDYSESSTMMAVGLVKTNIWVAADECGNANTLIRHDTCNMAAVKVRAVLGGGLIGIFNSNLMRDNLRAKQYLPSTSPYWNATATVPEQANYEAISPSLLEVTGPSAIVDWVLLELRDPITRSKVKGSKSALLLRNGNIINPDGTDVILFDTTIAGNYLLGLKHRNHLGIMIENGRFMNVLNPPMIDFTSTLELLYGGMNTTRVVDGVRRLWSGDLSGDGRVIYQGPSNDVFQLFYDIMEHPDNTGNLANFIRSGYEATDLNLDGNAIYQGPVNDRSMLLQHTILAHPDNSLFLSNYIAYTLLP